MLTFKTNVSLADFTTLHIGGPARYFVRAKTPQELADAFSCAREKGLPVFILGGGSNILVSDEGFDGIVVKIEIGGLLFVEKGDDAVEAVVGAGEDWNHLVALSVRHGLYGLENLSGIPGTVGAAPIQNIGAYGREVKDSIVSVDVFDPDTFREKTMTKNECDFAYRHSVFKTPAGRHFVVTRVRFSLSKKGMLDTSYKDVHDYFAQNGEKPTLARVRSAILSIRSRKFPDISKVGTAGSFFKNPIITAGKARELQERFPDLPQFPTENGVKIPIAWILDHALSLKGARSGTVGTFKSHSLVLINNGNAHASDVDAFAKEIERAVKEKTGIVLEREVTRVSFR